MPNNGDDHERLFNRRAEDVHWAVTNEKIERLEKDVRTIAEELQNRYVLIIRFIPIERGFYWLVGSIVGAVILAILGLVLRK